MSNDLRKRQSALDGFVSDFKNAVAIAKARESTCEQREEVRALLRMSLWGMEESAPELVEAPFLKDFFHLLRGDGLAPTFDELEEEISRYLSKLESACESSDFKSCH